MKWDRGYDMENKLKQKNKWKILFLGLLGLNIVIIIWLAMLIFLPLSVDDYKGATSKTGEEVAQFTISSSRDNLNKLVNTYLEELSKLTDIEYTVTIDDYVTLIGTIVAFDRDIPLTARFSPEVQKNGDLQLNIESISLGRMELPNKKVLEYVKKNYTIPKWVMVNPADESIYVAVTQMEMRSNFNVRVESFNLKKDDLAFRITVPNKAFDFRKAF